MRKVLLRILLSCTLMALLAPAAWAQSAELLADVANGDWLYSVTSEGVSIAKYQGRDANVTIPSSVTLSGVSYRLQAVGANAFEGNTTIRSVTIPSSITSLGKCAFKNCSSLSSITIQSNLVDCPANSINIYAGRDNAVFGGAGSNAEKLVVTFSDTVTRIPNYLFATAFAQSDNSYAHVTDVVIGSGVTEIGAYAFHRCYDLASLTLGDSVTTVGEGAFSYNASMNTLTMNRGLQTLGKNAFAANTALRTVNFNSGFAELGEGALSSCTVLPELVFPASTRTIGKKALEGCTQLRSVTINGRSVSLGENAFKNCSSLASLNVNANLENCPTNSVNIYSGRDNAVFMGAGSNAEKLVVTFSDTVARIPNYLFATAFEQSDNVYAHVTDVVIGSGVTEIGAYAFHRCYDLANLTLGDSVTSIGESAFSCNAAMTTLTMSRGVQTLGKNAFAANTALRTVNFNAGFAELGEGAFSSCTVLPELVFPGSIRTIGKLAFENCTQLRSVTINGKSVSLGECAFKNCSSLSSLNVNANLENCPANSVNIYAGQDNSVFHSAGRNAETFTVTFSDAVTRIPSYLFATAFEENRDDYAHVTDVYISAAVKEIGAYAFHNCYALAHVSYGGTQAEWGSVSVGENNAALTGAAFQYGVRLNIDRFRLGPITVSGANGEALSAIPAGKCLVTVPIVNTAAPQKPDGQILLAAYSAAGQFEECLYVGMEDLSPGAVMRVTLPLNNSTGRITLLKAFMVTSFSNMTPQSSSASFPA